MALDAPHPFVDFGIEHAVADGGGVVLHDRAPQRRDLVAEAFFQRQQVRGDVGAQGMDFRANVCAIS